MEKYPGPGRIADIVHSEAALHRWMYRNWRTALPPRRTSGFGRYEQLQNEYEGRGKFSLTQGGGYGREMIHTTLMPERKQLKGKWMQADKLWRD